MIVSGALPTTYTRPQGSENGAPVVTAEVAAEDFSALLFLIVGNLQVPEKSVVGAVQAHNTSVHTPMEDPEPAGNGREKAELQSQATAPAPDTGTCMQLTSDIVAQMLTEQDVTPATENLPSAAKTCESHDDCGETCGAIEAQILYTLMMQIQNAGLEGAVLPTSPLRGGANENAVSEAQHAAVQAAATPVIQERTAQAGAIRQNVATNGGFQSTMGAGAAVAIPDSPAENTCVAEMVTAETSARVYEPELPERETSESVKLPPNDSHRTAQGESTENANGPQISARELASGDAYTRTGRPYSGGGITTALSTSHPGHVSKDDGGLKVSVQLETSGGGTDQNAAPAIALSGGGKDTSANSHQNEHGGSLQQRLQDSGKHQSPLHMTAQDTAITYSAHALEVIQETPARPQDWHLLVDHVAGEIRGHIRIGKSEAVIRLDPPELGNLKIDLRMEGDKVEARIYAENHESATLIEAHLPELRQALAESRVEHVEVQVDNSNWSSARGDGQQGRRREPGDGHPQAHDSGSARREDSNPREPARPQSNWGAGRVSMWA
jgi:flagellar hook-length control protein FliK